MCQFSCIFNGILGPNGKIQVASRMAAILNFWQKVKYIWDTGAKTFQPTKNY